MASALSISDTVMGKFRSWFTFNMLLKFVLVRNPISRCRIMSASAPLISNLRKKGLVLLENTKERVSVNRGIRYIRSRIIKIVQYFAALVKIEDRIYASVDKHGRFVVGIHGNSELTGNINE